MRRFRIVLASATVALMLTSLTAQAQPLTVVDVNAPAVNCVFRTNCTITVDDSTGPIALPFIAAAGTAWLQSRIFPVAPAGTPAAGKTGYVYRISLTQASGAAECLGGLILNFGPVTKLPYKDGQMADVFVITTGGLGTIGIKAAEKFGDVIVFDFSKPLCLDGGPNVNNTTFFFGLAAATAPVSTTAQIYAAGNPPLYEVNVRVPAH